MKSSKLKKGKAKETNVLVIAGEASGDSLGASILRRMNELETPLQMKFWGCGGHKMERENVEILYDIQQLETIGIIEAIQKIFTLKLYARKILEKAIQTNTKNAILIDYPGFNLYLSKYLKKWGIRCYMVVSPQIWAWNYKRVHKIKKYIDLVLCLYHFEVDIYKKEGIEACFIGHPLVKEIQNKKRVFRSLDHLKESGKPKIALLPGSRKSEIKKHITKILILAKRLRKKYPKAIFYITTPNSEATEYIKKYPLPAYVKLLPEKTDEVLANVDAAVACSGTVTLQCALWRTPFVLIYVTSFLSYMIAKNIIYLPYLGIINVLGGKFITKEFIQYDLKVNDLIPEVERLISDNEYRKRMIHEFDHIFKAYYRKNSISMAASVLGKKLGGGSDK